MLARWTIQAVGGSGIDESAVRRALAILIDPADAHEIRGLPSGRSRRVHGSDLDGAVEAIRELDDNRSLYYTLNPVRPDLIGAARKADILRRCWFLVDVDAIRPEWVSLHGQQVKGADLCATEEEKVAAGQLATAVDLWLAELGWPAPVLIDSGNGWHLLYRIELPNTNLARQWLRAILVILAERFDNDQAVVDRKTHDAPRIAKLPGTMSRKGPDLLDRPHRLCRLVSVPEVIEAVPTELIQELAAPALKGKAKSKSQANGDTNGHAAGPWRMVASDGREDAYLRRAVEGELIRVFLAPEGDRNNALNQAAFSLGTLLSAGLNRKEIESKLTHAAHQIGLGETETARTIASGLDAGEKEPRQVPSGEKPSSSQAKYVPNADETESVGASGRTYEFPLVVKGSSVQPKQVQWLWPDRIPLGFLTLMAGRTGVGKSFTALDIAARITRGGEIPDQQGECFEVGGVLIISEDSHEYMLAPRLIEAGADMDLVNFMSWEAMATYALADVVMLEDVYQAAGCPILVVIDPPTNFLGGKDEHKNAEVRSVLMGVSIWAMRHNLACAMITHCNKGIKKDMSALDRIIGSVAWASTSRIAHIYSPHPEEREQAVFLPLKNNLGRMPEGLAYRIVPTEAFAKVEWLGTIDFDADDAMAGQPRKSRGVVATEWLMEQFRKQREWRSDELKRNATEAGVSKNALWSPEVNALPIRKRQHFNASGERFWTWIAEPGWPPESDQENATQEPA